MTDKEQIKCNYKFQDKENFSGNPYCTCFDEWCENLSFICDHNCQVYEDLKQLARKTQLSIKQSKELIRLRKELKKSTVKNRNLKQECEELKSKNSILKNSLKPFQNEYFKNLETIVIAGLAKKSIRITAENTQLRKALEEIEDICNVADRYELDELQETIFNIINKVKGEECN